LLEEVIERKEIIMSDVNATKSTPKKKAAAAKAKKPANHPKYSDMIKAALTALKERGGSSRQAILKYIAKNYNVGHDEKVINQHLKMSLRAGVKNGSLKPSKGTGASGSVRLGESAKKSPAKAKKPKAVKPKKAKKPAGEKKAKTAKKSAKSPKKAKDAKPKTAAAAKPKKAAAAKPKKAAATKPAAAAAAKPKKTTSKPKKTASKPKKAAAKN